VQTRNFSKYRSQEHYFFVAQYDEKSEKIAARDISTSTIDIPSIPKGLFD